MERTMKNSRQFLITAAFLLAWLLLTIAVNAQELTYTNLDQLAISADTGEKPQSKVWTYDAHWWAVLANSSGTHLWKLVGTTWTNVLTLSTATNTHADAKVVGDVVHILLYSGTSSELVSVEYVSATDTYQFWTTRPTSVNLTLDSGVETATIDIDSEGRMWLASDAATDINVRWSDSPYSTWSSPITLASSVNSDDICVVTALDGKIGVLWSNQSTQRFGFRVHTDGADPGTWSADEVPASQSALSVGAGMADDHLNVALASDGTLYAAVKTSYDTPGYPKVALLIRRPAGTWDDLYEVDQSGTRGIVLLNEAQNHLMVVYTSSEGYNDIVYKETSTSTISFGSQQTLMSGSYNNATSTKQNYNGEIVILAASSTHAAGVLGTQGLVGHWQMEENGGTTLIDASFYGNDGTLYGDPGWVAGKVGDYALDLDGTGDYALVPDDASLDITDEITLAAWVKPGEQATQYLLKKALGTSIDGYELALASGTSSAGPGKAFVRFNRGTSGDTYRLNSDTQYPYDGNTWVHLATTYDGSTIRFYYNGVEESTLPATISIAANAQPFVIGAQSDETYEYQGQIDDARVYNRALSAAEIEALATPTSLPEAPTATAATNITATSFTANWNAVAGADNYRLDVATDELFTSFVAGYNNLTVAGTSQAVTGLTASTPYYYRARAVNAAGISGNSNTITVTTLATIEDLVGHWKMEENSGTTLIDASTFGNDGTINGGAGWAVGKVGSYAFNLDGADDYALVPDDASLDITDAITLSAWIRPTKTAAATQYILRKGTQGGTDGYELSLASSGKAFVRFNQATSGNTYRLDTATSYPLNGSAWMHLAATCDGSLIRIYVNGIEDNTAVAAPSSIATNSLSLGIGAQSDGGTRFQGQIDDAKIYNRALSATEILFLATTPLATAGTDIANTSFTANWNAVTNADDYRLDVATDDQFVNMVAGYDNLTVSGTSHSVTGLSSATTYYYRIRGSNSVGTTANSNTITVVTSGTLPDLVGHWPMEEGSGSVVADASTYNNDGTIFGSPAWVTGIIGNYALNFNGTSDYVAVSDAASLDIADAITLAAWIKPDQKNTLSIIKKNGGGTGYELYCGAAGTVYMRLNENDTYRAISTTPYPTDGTTWMHVAATYDGTNMKMYINGQLEHTVTGPATISVNDNELRIARDAAGTKYFDGQIDDARVYNRALTAEEISVLAFIPGGSLVGHWAMEEGSGTVLVDSSEYENDATITGNPGWVSGIKGLALDLDGANDYALAPDDPSLDITDAITLAVWVKPEKLDTQYLIKKATTDGTDGYELSLATDPSSQPPEGDGRAFVRFNQATSGNSYRLNSVTRYPYDGTTWIHLAATYDGTTIRFYYNGVEESTLAATISIATNNLPLAIGAQSDGDRKFLGQMDDARLYNRALSAEEILALATLRGVLVETKIFLEGPYDAVNDQMTTTINGNIPTTSPYSEDPRTVSSIPANITDWVLVQLRSTATGSAVASRSAFLHKDGCIVADDGTTGQITLDEVAGDYYIVIKHRNHLAVMSANAIALSLGSSTLYDFTNAQNKAYGTNPMKELETGVFGMRAGDGNSDGGVDALDKNLVWRQQNGTTWEYSKYGDFNLDGGIDALDLNLKWRPNNGTATQVPE